MFKTLSASITNCTGILRVTVQDSHASSTAQAVVECNASTLDIGDSITIVLGYTGDTGTVFTGYVKMIERKAPDGQYVITCQDAMTRAIDYFIASSNPDAPLSYSNISAESLVGNIFAQAGLTNYGFDASSFTFGVVSPVEVNLVSAYDWNKQIADILAFHIYADTAGKVWFVDRKPYVTGGDSPVATITTKTQLAYTESEKDLRNRVVVYGSSGIYAEASASSPYLPAGFYKTTVVATTVIQDTGVAQDTADYNLALFNRLTKQVTVSMEGDHSFVARQVVTLNDTFTGASGDWYIFGIEHAFGPDGYYTNMTLRQ